MSSSSGTSTIVTADASGMAISLTTTVNHAQPASMLISRAKRFSDIGNWYQCCKDLSLPASCADEYFVAEERQGVCFPYKLPNYCPLFQRNEYYQLSRETQ